MAKLFPDFERIYRLYRRPLQALSGLKAELSQVQRTFDHGTLDEALSQIGVFMAADVIDGVKPILDTKNSDLSAFDRDRLRLVGRDLVGFADAFPHAKPFARQYRSTFADARLFGGDLTDTVFLIDPPLQVAAHLQPGAVTVDIDKLVHVVFFGAALLPLNERNVLVEGNADLFE